MKSLIVKNPYNGQELAKLAYATDQDIAQALLKGQGAFQKWRYSSAWERSQLLTKIAQDLETQAEDFAQTICKEAGKPIHFARIEVQRALGVLRWAAAEAQRFSGEILRLDASSNGRAGFGINTRFARGLVLGITPFNFPLNLVVHKVAPAIACGCTILIKPSPATPLTALKLAALFQKHTSEPIVQVILADDESTARLTQSQEIAMISFTGSARVGHLIRQQAPQKPVTLELGGNAWVVVLEDTPKALLPSIAKRIAGAAYGYAGQSCISVQNAGVAESLWPEFQDALIRATKDTAFGDPENSSVVCGPVIRMSEGERIQSELKKAPAGAQLTQSTRQEGKHQSASLVAPTLVTLSKMPASPPTLIREEVFGPVMIATPTESLDSVISIINSSRYGLQAGVYTQNWSAIERLYRELEVGGLIVNDVPTTRYDHQPYGGVKDSGEGREGVRYAMEEMTQSKFLALSSVIPQ